MSKLPHRLRAIYRQFIESKPVNRGERHAFLTRVIPPMFEVVAEPVLLDLLCRHHRAQMGTWRTDLDDHMQEAEKMLADYGPKYRTMLSERERIVFYDRLSDGKRMAALRICRGLARSEKAQKSGFFFLACSELAVRIGCHPDTAHFILREFKAEGVIERIKIGDVCSTQALGERKRKATTWRWMASLGLAAFAGENISHESAGDNEKPRFLSQGPDDKTRQAES